MPSLPFPRPSHKQKGEKVSKDINSRNQDTESGCSVAVWAGRRSVIFNGIKYLFPSCGTPSPTRTSSLQLRKNKTRPDTHKQNTFLVHITVNPVILSRAARSLTPKQTIPYHLSPRHKNKQNKNRNKNTQPSPSQYRSSVTPLTAGRPLTPQQHSGTTPEPKRRAPELPARSIPRHKSPILTRTEEINMWHTDLHESE